MYTGQDREKLVLTHHCQLGQLPNTRDLCYANQTTRTKTEANQCPTRA